MHRGYIKIWRKFIEWEWYGDVNMMSLFLHLLLKANYKESKFMGIIIPRGSLVCGRRELAKTLNISEMSIRTCINKLKSTQEITTKTTNKFTIVSVCNYEEYQIKQEDFNQENNQVVNQRSTNNQPTINQQLTTSKELKNVRIKEYKNKDLKHQVIIPDYLQEIIKSFMEMRKEIKKPATERAIELIIRDVQKWYPNRNDLQIKAIENSIKSSWQGVFQLKDEVENIAEKTVKSFDVNAYQQKLLDEQKCS